MPSAIDPTCVADGPFRLWVLLYIAHTQLWGWKKAVGRELILLLEIKVKGGHFIVEIDRGKPKIYILLKLCKQWRIAVPHIISFCEMSNEVIPYVITWLYTIFSFSRHHNACHSSLWKSYFENMSVVAMEIAVAAAKLFFFLSFTLLLKACSTTKVRLWNMMNVLRPIFMTTRWKSGYYRENHVL